MQTSDPTQGKVSTILTTQAIPMIWGILVAIILWVGVDYVIGLFTQDSQVSSSAKSYLLIVPITFSFLGIVMMTSSIANGIGNLLPALAFTIARLLILYVPLVWGLSHYFGLEGIYFATAIANLLVGLMAWYWSSRKCQGGTAASVAT